MENKYIVYIDESNILSKIGNSVYVALYVLCLDKDNFTKKITDIEQVLKINYLHWVDIPWRLRIRFAEKIKHLDFTYKVVIYKNPINSDITLRNFLSEIISSDKCIYRIIIDGKRSKRYENKLKSISKNKGLRFGKVIFTDDKNEPSVRLADFIAGMTRSFVDNKNENNTYIYNLLKQA